ncbi:MAG: hypothetical protein ACSLE1_04325 [Sphingobium sp.]
MTMTDSGKSRSAHTSAALGAGTAALITFVVVLLIVAFIAIGAGLGLVALYAGFLLMWYFGNVDVLDPAALPATAIGALGGAGTAWLLQTGVTHSGPAGALPALILIVGGVFIQLMGWIPLLFNRAYFLYVTVMAAPLLQMHEKFVDVLLTIGVATLFFGGVAIVGRRVMAARAAAPAEPAT